MSLIDYLNLHAGQAFVDEIPKLSLCCLTNPQFQYFKAAQALDQIVGAITGQTRDGRYYWWAIYITKEDLMLSSKELIREIAEGRIQDALHRMTEDIEHTCFKYWVRKVRKDNGLET